MNKIKQFIADKWVSWVIEISIMSIVAFFIISETRATAEQTRAMLAKYDKAISKFASEKSVTVSEHTKDLKVKAIQFMDKFKEK